VKHVYIDETDRYYDSEGQHTRRAPFLLLVQEDGEPCASNLRGLVRQVALKQCGQWMMGFARIAGQTLTVSGTYGSDGLPITVGKKAYAKGTPMPGFLYDLWNKGGGWNSAGSEAAMLREWGKWLMHETYKGGNRL